ncbi:MAG: transposase [Firmicutes bacterium]|nr:transposase [Bacillota bacterium]
MALDNILALFMLPLFGALSDNGYTEGCNNLIKVIKRTGYGVKNFNRFRNRILHIASSP